MIRRTIFLVAAVLVALPAIAQDVKPDYAAMTEAERETARAENAARIAAIKANPPNVPGRGAPGGPGATPGMVIVYDTGTFSALPTLPAVGGTFIDFSIGNRFDTQNLNPLSLPFTVTSVAVWPALVDGASTGSGAAFLSIFGPTNTANTTASGLNSAAFTFSAGTWNTVALGFAFTGAGVGSFQVGLWNPGDASTTTTLPCATDCVGLDTGTTMTQGYHAMRVQDINGSSYAPIPLANALVRPIGTDLPVELMSFSIED